MGWALINKEGERGPPSCLEHILTRGLVNWGPLKMHRPFSVAMAWVLFFWTFFPFLQL